MTAEKVALKREKEIRKWEKEQARPKRNLYMFYLLFTICLVYVTDEVASQIATLMKAEIVSDLFARFGEKSVGMFDLLTMISVPFMVLSMLYKPLSDRFGRKIFLVINTFGMGVSMFIIFLSRNIVLYLVGACICAFFTPHDMQVVYIMETAPKKHRAKIYAFAKCMATLGILLIPLLRRVFMTDASKWRMVYLVPALVGMGISAFALFSARETDPFMESRLRYLRLTDEERAREALEKDSKNAQGGIVSALKFAFSHKQLRWLFISRALAEIGLLVTMEYEVILANGYAQSYLADGTYASADAAMNAASVGPVTAALFLFPIGSALMQLTVGFISDKWGRKTACVLMSSLTLLSFIAFTIGAKHALSPYLVGFLAGACVGSFWGNGDTNEIMISESAPTNLRSSVMSAELVATGVGCAVCYTIGVPLITHFGNSMTSAVTLCFAVPGLLFGLLTMLFKTHDTKDVDIDTVTGCEWD